MSLKGVPKSAAHREAIGRGRRTISDDVVERLLRVAAENCINTLPNSKLAMRFGISRPQVSKILKKHNVVRPTCR